MDLLQQRLGEIELEGDDIAYEFVLDAEEDAKNGQSDSNHGRSNHYGNTAAIPVKTLIWEAEILLENSSDQEENPSASSSSHIDVIYFATALHHHDRVKEGILKQRLCENLPLLTCTTSNRISVVKESSDPRTLKTVTVLGLKLAETAKAEELAGYMSGTIPPFGHTMPMLLIIDRALEAIVMKKHGNGSIENAIVSTKDSNQQILLSTGSGSFRHSLLINWQHMLRFAKVLGSGVCIAPITMASDPSSESQAQPIGIPSTMDTSDGDRPIDAVDVAGINHRESGQPAARETPYTVEPLSEEMQSLGRLLRDSSLREGKAKVIRTVISQAGDRFPQVSHYSVDFRVLDCLLAFVGLPIIMHS